MTDHIRSTLDHQLDAAAPPSGLRSEDLARRGRRRLLRRRLSLTGVTAVLLAGAVTGGLTLLPDTPGPGVQAAATTQQDYPLPAWRPGVDYSWQPGTSDIRENQATRDLSAALWRFMGALPHAIPVSYDSNQEKVGVPLSEAAFPAFTRRTERIDADGVPTGYERPVYNQFHPLLFDGASRPEMISVSLYPRGSYIFGASSDPADPRFADWRHLVSGCVEAGFELRGERGWTVTFTCAERTGPGGERVLTVREYVRGPSGEGSFTNIVLVQTSAGNAIVVRDQGLASATGAAPEPGLDFDGLTSLALALPAVIVE